MGLKAYRTIKATTQLVGAAAGVYAMSLGADPLSAFAMIAAIISGPEVLEYVVTHDDRPRGQPSDSDSD